MRNEAGDIEATRKGIANICAKIYGDLHSSKNDKRKDEEDNEERDENTCDRADDHEKHIENDEQDKHIPEFTMEELSVAIGAPRKGNRQTAKESKRKISKELTKKRQK